MSTPSSAHSEGVYVRRFTRSEGLFFDEFATDSAWLRDDASVHLPPLPGLKQITVKGEIRPHPETRGIEAGLPTLDLYLRTKHVATIDVPTAQSWEVAIDVPTDQAGAGFELRLELRDVTLTNFLAWFGRIAEHWPMGQRFQRFRKQNRNRQVRVSRIEADGQVVFDFSNRHAPYSPAFARSHTRLGMNVVGFMMADLGIGESARCMVRAADAAQIPAAPVPLKLRCKARFGDQSFAAFVTDQNPHVVNVFHLDPPASSEIDTHHGTEFRQRKYNVGYWAWELPEFPDSWISNFDIFNEIWCPSDFARSAIADKSPLAVITMPHAVEFTRPLASMAELRTGFSLPLNDYLFLFVYDLNSYTERKNPGAVIEAFRRSGLGSRGASLVIKVHSVAGNERDLEGLRARLVNLPGAILITESFSRNRVYELEAACDCFVSLHRAEGFGFAVAECMYLGKPVIATDWSATSEYLNETNGAPVRASLITLDKHHGPYAKGQTWADPNIDHAAEWMQRLFNDRALGDRLGIAARQTIERDFSLKTIGARYRRRLEAIASW